ncbi:hypothetical protein SAMN02745146_0833 [Hymenobacter daecheongensis DSM 21074]|uniref:Uncharacterized protein n=1 Tax=Hymenobacter daecheongensis DSM 21074 TaxID=1121955 RepID=A0A1M6B0Q7_9BACT|nr:hypothetical protein [Hymenobacter daecheongensis]SHI42281.1 hypothetical protein SAMN02745146_0833 [Hymenobacter daecheongensis DSM 21074]
MPSHHNESDPKAKVKHNTPAAEGQPKADALPTNQLDPETEDRLEQEATDAGLRHPNRNLNKPDIDKPAYS